MGQQIVNGLFLGSIYALFALGYTLVFGVLDILNLAHAAVFMLASFLALTAVTAAGLPILAALPLAMVGAAFIGLLLERVAFRPLRRRTDSNISGLISSLAMATVFEAVALQIWGPNVTRFPFGTLPEGRPVSLLGAEISRLQLTTVAVAVALFLLLTWLVQGTRLGRQVRAVAESPRAARVLGIDVDRAIAASFFISSALGGAAGVLYGLAYNAISPDMGRGIELKGLAVIILGGMGSMPGAVVAGFALGLSEVFVVAHLGASYRDAVSFAGLFLILVLRPRGLLGAAALREA
ncbi:MAG TPA: branched-chain amino acid ABC transporter permease [Anaeromyxobacteraceae bacterium]|nr:branched-chain amino acid ABC transporter permease [Anaeromyxobacteraceae bacterium]